MGEIFVPGPLSGRNYGFRIAGDTPTVDEQQRIDALIRQDEADFAREYEETFGDSLLASRGIGGQLSEFFRGIPRGAGGLFETAALGAATPFQEETEAAARERIRQAGIGLQNRFAPPIGREEMVGGRLGEAVGSMLGIAGVGVGTTLATAPVAGPAAPFLGFGAAAGVGAAAGAGEASERARRAGATQEERNLAAQLGLIPGAAEAIPLFRLSRVLERGGFRERLTRALIAGGEEGVQEAASSIAQNLIEQGVYNPEQGTFEGTGEDLGYGAGAGALIQAISDLVIPGRLRARVGDGTPPPPAAGPTPAPPAPATVVNTRTATVAGGPMLIVSLSDGQLLTLPANAAQADIDTAVAQYNSAQKQIIPPAPPSREITDEDMADIGEGPVDLDPTAPITTETLDALGVPKIASIYRQVAAERLSGPQLDAALERYAASASTIPAQQASGQRVSDFLQRRAAAIPGQQELALGQPAQPQRVEPSPVGVSPVGSAQPDVQAVAPEPVLGGLGAAAGVEPAAPVGMAVPDRGVGTVAEPAAAQPAALTEPGPARPISDADAFDLALQEAEAARAAAPAVAPVAEPEIADVPFDASPLAPSVVGVDPFAGMDLPETPAVAPLTLAATQAPPEVTPLPSADQLPALRRAARQAEQRAKNEFASLARPVARGMGIQLDPEGAAGQELLARGVTRKDSPGLFAKKAGEGLKDVDNIPADEHPAIMREGLVNLADDSTNFDRNDLLDALEAEARGTPRLPAAALEAQSIRNEVDRIEREMQAARAEEYAPPLQPKQDPFSGLKGIERLYGEKANAWDRPLSEPVVAALQNDDLLGALQELASTTKNPAIKQLITRLLPFVSNVRVAVVEPDILRLLSEVYDDGSTVIGAFIRSFTDAELADFVASQRISPEAAVALRSFENMIVLDENTGLTPHVLLHETVHAATTAVLDNPSHPLTQQLEQITVAARGALPGRVYELSDAKEFVAFGMTNPGFIKDLAFASSIVNGQRVSLLDRFINAITNFMRGLSGRRRKPVLSAKDDLDLFFESLLAPAPEYRGVGSVYSAAYRSDSSRKLMDGMKANVAIPDPKKVAQETFNIVNDNVMTPAQKGFLLDLTTPLLQLTEYAKSYLPTADQVYSVIQRHHGRERRLLDWTNDTLEPIERFLKKHGQDVVNQINKIRYEATENQYQVDPRKPASEYDKFELTQIDYNPDGTEAKRTRRQFQTRQQREDAWKRLNQTAQQGRPRAANRVDPDAARVAKHKELQALYNNLPEGGKEVVNTLFNLPEVYRKELQDAFMARLESMLPGQRSLHERIYKNVFEKLFAQTLIDPYQALSRRGEYKLSYEAIDPDSGELTVFKHSFTSMAERNKAIRELQSIEAAESGLPLDQRPNRIGAVTPYQSTNDFAGGRVRIPMAALSAILNKVADKNQLGDPAIEQSILELLFESAPETSFLQSFQRRAGTPGYIGDLTPLKEQLSAGDTIEVVKSNGYRLATKIADIRSQAEMVAVRQNINADYDNFISTILPREQDPVKRSRQQANAALYRQKMLDALDAPFRATARWSRVATSLGYTMALGGNVSTAAITFSQLPLFIAPYLFGKFGGSTGMQSIGVAMRIIASSGNNRMVERVSPDGGIEAGRREGGFYDYSLANMDYEAGGRAAYLKPLYDAASAAGTLTRSMVQELVDASTASGFTQKLAAWSGLMQHQAERYMREITMTADYLGNVYQAMPGMKNQMSFKQFVKAAEDGTVTIPQDIADAAAAEAVRTGDYTNGSIYASQSVKLSQGDLGRVLFLFKRFPLAMMNLLVHSARRSVGTDPVDRRAARIQLATMMGSLGLFTGALGMPLMHTVGLLYDTLWPRDEDDEDFETMLRTGFLGELGSKGLANYMFGVNLTDRIGLNGVFYRTPLNAAELPWYGALIEGYGGPVVGLGTKWLSRAPFFFSEGEYFRGIETALPTSLANMLKSIRFATEGARTLRGDPIIETFSPYELGAQFFGFMPARYEQRLSINRAQQEIGKNVDTAVQNLLRRLYIARREGDRDSFQEVLEEIRQFNGRVPPSARITRDSIKRSLDSHRRTTDEMQAGITLSRRMRPELMQLASDYGPVSWMDRR